MGFSDRAASCQAYRQAFGDGFRQLLQPFCKHRIYVHVHAAVQHWQRGRNFLWGRKRDSTNRLQIAVCVVQAAGHAALLGTPYTAGKQFSIWGTVRGIRPIGLQGGLFLVQAVWAVNDFLTGPPLGNWGGTFTGTSGPPWGNFGWAPGQPGQQLGLVFRATGAAAWG